ncbi:MAG TPA: ribosome maturation factor RimM [Candidatus Solibacter sp.]|nr:ribosome maturation factor RimM [Candidatus Solibacter sp.]
MPTGARVTLARIVRPRGRKGEVAADILTDFPQRLTKLREVWLAGPAGQDRRARIRACWLSHSHGGQAIFHFEGCDSIDQAKTLVGLDVQIPLSQRAPLPHGRHFVSDLAGCAVWQRHSAGQPPERLGEVRDVQFPGGGTPLLAVDTPAGEVLIPLAEEICVLIDLPSRRIEVVLPEGLLDLNR